MSAPCEPLTSRLTSAETRREDAAHVADGTSGTSHPDRVGITIIVPCFNEFEALPNLWSRLDQAEDAVARVGDVTFLLVDDASTDATWAGLQDRVNKRANYRAVQHPVNQGVAAAIVTGIQAATTPLVCTIDADCTYDPGNLAPMIAMLDDSTDLVTASPYHPSGGVDGASRWRIGLSRMASRCYRLLARNKLHTYTSCFRVCRREAVQGIDLKFTRYAGVAELLWHVDRSGGRIAEYPAVLTTRKFGQSKLRVFPAVADHARLMTRCSFERIFGTRSMQSNPVVSATAMVGTAPSQDG